MISVLKSCIASLSIVAVILGARNFLGFFIDSGFWVEVGQLSLVIILSILAYMGVLWLIAREDFEHFKNLILIKMPKES